MKNKLFFTGKVLSTIFAIVLAILLAATPVLNVNQAQISAAIGAQDQVVIEDEEAADIDTQYYKTDFNSVAELKAEERRLAQQISAEGSVLVKNDNDALPVAKGSKVSFYSVASVDHLVSGGGSSQANPADTVSLKTAFVDEGFVLNEDLYNWYTANKETYSRTSVSGSYAGKTYNIKDAPWNVLPESKNNQADLAIFVLTRFGGESTDLFMVRANTGEGTGAPMDSKYEANNQDVKNGNYLELNDNEISVLKGLKAQKDAGKISKIMILMNFSNQVELDFIDSDEYGIDAALWVGTTGSVGSRAVADIVSGDVNPSGSLTDTFWTEHHYNPVYANWTDSWFGYQFEEKPSGLSTAYADEKVYNHTGSNEPTLPYVVYEEGIYNGYKYTETRYEDVVMGTANVGSFNYAAAVQYPFGYGLSYTTFSKQVVGEPEYDADSDTYTINVKVTNTGSVAGKHTVQIYLQKPYTQYDKNTGVEKSSVELVGYGKTSELAAGASETLSISIKQYYFATYDSYGAKGYILENGTYYMIAASDAHEAVNSVLAYKAENVSDINVDSSKLVGTGDKTLVAALDMNDLADADDNGVDAKTYRYSAATGNEVTNKFDNADPLYYMADESRKEVNYLSRNDWNGTVQFGLTSDHQQINNTHAVLYWSAQVEADIREQNAMPTTDNVAYPTMGSSATSYTLVDLKGVDKDNEMWQRLLDQMSWDDMVKLLTDGERKTQAVSSIAKPQTIDHNGAIGVNCSFGANAGVNRGYAVQNNDPDKGQTPIAYPCNGIVAATFNDELVYEYGQQWGEDALWAGYSGLYGPGANGHRSAYSGRNFEYYSEDGILGGQICANLCKGIVEHGILVYLKHAILNDQEINRLQVSTFANEQTIREIYLRPFELAITDGGAQNVMTAYNRIGTKYTGVHGFINTVLRDECGMTGFAVTDYLTGGHEQRMPANILNGNDLPDRNWAYAASSVFDKYNGSSGNYGEFAWAMRQACHNVLYGVANSSAMNGFSSNTNVITFTPTWVYAFESIKTSVWWIFVSSVLLCVLSVAYDKLKEKNVLCDVPGGDNKGGTSGTNGGSGSNDKKPKVVNKEYKAGVKAKGGSTSKPKKTILDYAYAGTAIALAAAFAIGQGATIITLVSKIAENNAIIALEKQPEEAKVINPDDIVTEGVSEYKFEAETAQYEGVTGWNGEFSDKNTAQCYVLNEGFSGNILLWNINQGNSSKSNKLTFNFNSDKAETIVMKVMVSGLATDSRFSSFVNLRVNGELYACDDIVKRSDSTASVASPYGTHSDFALTMTELSIPIEIKSGENSIVFATRMRGSNTMFGFDYITLNTTASITGYNPELWDVHAEFENEAAKPGINSKGRIKLCHLDDNGEVDYVSYYTAPSLSNGVEAGIYKIIDNEQANAFEYYFYNEELKICSINKGPYTLTFNSTYVSVNAGGNSVSLTTTYPVDSSVITINAPAKRKVAGWYNTANPSEYWLGETFRMPERNMTVAPIFDAETYMFSEADSDVYQVVENLRSGKVDQMAANLGVSSNTQPIRESACSGIQGAVIRQSMKETILVDAEGYAETAINYSYGAINAGEGFGTMAPCMWRCGGSRTVTSVYKNTGSTTLNFETFIYTAGSSFTAMNNSKMAGSSHNITLAPGQTTSITFTVSGGHNNMMTGYVFNESVSSMSFACYQYIDSSQNLTLSGATFKDGSTVKKLDPNTTLTMDDVNVTLVGEETISYWYNVNDNSQKWAADLSDFKTTGSALTIAPKIIKPSVQYTLTLQNAKFADNSTSMQLSGEDVLPSGIVADEITGKKRYGWVDVNTGVYYTDATFEMPEANTTIAPVYDYTDETAFLKRESQPINNGSNGGIDYKLTMRYGKVQLYADNAQMIVKNVTGFSSNPDGRAKGAVKLSDGTYELSSYIGSASGVNNTYAVTYFSQYQNWTALGDGAKRKAAFTFTNYGSEDISFEVMISSASGNPTGSAYDKLTITVKAGETYEADMDLGANGKDSIILHFAFTSEASELSLAYNFSILKVEE